MCDGTLCEKIEIIRDLMYIEKPEATQDYLQQHMTWTLDELRSYRKKYPQIKHQPGIIRARQNT